MLSWIIMFATCYDTYEVYMIEFPFSRRSKHATPGRSERVVPDLPTRNTRQLLQRRRELNTTNVYHAIDRQKVPISYSST